jgi:hypothetical protein
MHFLWQLPALRSHFPRTALEPERDIHAIKGRLHIAWEIRVTKNSKSSRS